MAESAAEPSATTSTAVAVPVIAPQDDGSGLQATDQPVEPAAPISEQEVGDYKEQDRYLPVRILYSSFRLSFQKLNMIQIANVSRIMKNAIPPSAKIAKDAKETLQECVSEFISFVTSEAAERCALEKRKTLGGEDVLTAMNALGFDDYAQVLKIYLVKLRTVSG